MRSTHLRVAPTRGSLPAARAWVVARARENGLPTATTQVVELLASELVANALVHAGGREVVVRAGTDRQTFAVIVQDASDQMPVMRRTGPEVPGGHGMHLIQRLATQWGADRHHPHGKTVWARIATQRPQGRDRRAVPPDTPRVVRAAAHVRDPGRHAPRRRLRCA